MHQSRNWSGDSLSVPEADWLIALARVLDGRFEEESVRRLDHNQRCLFISNAAMQWLDIRLQLVGVALVTGISTVAVLQHHYGSVDPGEHKVVTVPAGLPGPSSPSPDPSSVKGHPTHLH